MSQTEPSQEQTREQPLEGGAFYDDPAVFATYRAHRDRATNPNDLIEEPAFLDFLGDVQGQRVLDLGCGAAAFGRRLMRAGCRSYLGIDASANMVAAATATLSGTSGQVRMEAMEEFSPERHSVDLVVSRLALHYVQDLAPVFARVRQALVPGGRLVFSVEHPVITSCARGWDSHHPRGDWLVDDYFVAGRRETTWLGARVVKYHRTIEDYIRLVQDVGLRLERLSEARPRAEQFASEAEFQRRSRIPLFLLLAATAIEPHQAE
jgi:SAM-dependent methyltransferase